MSDQKPLYSAVAEEAVLGSMFLDSEAAKEGKSLLRPEHFYNPVYKTIFEAMQAIEVVDIVTVTEELRRRGEAERIGLPVLANVATSVGSSVNLRTYAKELERLAYFRRCIAYGQTIVQK